MRPPQVLFVGLLALLGASSAPVAATDEAKMLTADPDAFAFDPEHWRVPPSVVVQRVSAALRHAALRELFARCLALNGGVFSPARIPQQGLRHRWRELLHPAELWD